MIASAPARDEARSANRDLGRAVAELRARFRQRGFYEKPAARVLLPWIAALWVGAGGLAVYVLAENPALRIAGFVASCYALLVNATIGHTASHDALSDRPALNRLVAYVAHPLALGMSARYWHKSHIQTHHTAPNVVGADDDCDLRPVFAINQQHAAEGGSMRRAWYRAQGFVFPLALTLNGFNILRQGWLHLFGELADRSRRSVWTFVDLGCLLAHLGLWVVLPMAVLSPGEALALYAVRVVIMGSALFAILAPGHFPAEARCFAPETAKQVGSVFAQLAGTVNFRTGPVGRLLCSGLEYQIEHHLFPTLSHVHYREVAPLVRDLCERHGLPYRTLGWGEAIWKSYRVFFVPKPVHDRYGALHESLAREAAGEAAA